VFYRSSSVLAPGRLPPMSSDAIDGRTLAELHRNGSATDDGIRLVAYAESPRQGDWSLRSALVRYAQPEPQRASAVLELVRRTDGALKPSLRLLERSEVPTDPELSAGRTRIDARAADLARVAVTWPDELDRVIAEYESVEPLAAEERELVPLLAVAVELDALGDVLARWADDRSTARPDDAADAIARRAFGMLAALGVDRERRPPRRS
jgi:hypothetical protein